MHREPLPMTRRNPFGPPNDGSGRTSPSPINLPIRAVLAEIDGQVVTLEFDKRDGAGICRVEVSRAGHLVGVVEFRADALAGFRKLQRFFVTAWQANVIRGDWPTNFWGLIKPQ